MADQLYVIPEKMSVYIKELYRKAGLSEADAMVCADCTVKTNLWGVDSR